MVFGWLISNLKLYTPIKRTWICEKEVIFNGNGLTVILNNLDDSAIAYTERLMLETSAVNYTVQRMSLSE
jgi:hypothetical protein